MESNKDNNQDGKEKQETNEKKPLEAEQFTGDTSGERDENDNAKEEPLIAFLRKPPSGATLSSASSCSSMSVVYSAARNQLPVLHKTQLATAQQQKKSLTDWLQEKKPPTLFHIDPRSLETVRSDKDGNEFKVRPQKSIPARMGEFQEAASVPLTKILGPQKHIDVIMVDSPCTNESDTTDNKPSSSAENKIKIPEIQRLDNNFSITAVEQVALEQLRLYESNIQPSGSADSWGTSSVSTGQSKSNHTESTTTSDVNTQTEAEKEEAPKEVQDKCCQTSSDHQASHCQAESGIQTETAMSSKSSQHCGKCSGCQMLIQQLKTEHDDKVKLVEQLREISNRIHSIELVQGNEPAVENESDARTMAADLVRLFEKSQRESKELASELLRDLELCWQLYKEATRRSADESEDANEETPNEDEELGEEPELDSEGGNQ